MLNTAGKRSRKQAATASTHAHGGVYGHSAADSHVKIGATRRITTIILAVILTIGGMVFAAPQNAYAAGTMTADGWELFQGYSIAPDDGTGIEWGYAGNNKWEYNTETKVFTVTPVDPTTISPDHKGTIDVGTVPGRLPSGNNVNNTDLLPWRNAKYFENIETIIFNADVNGNKVSITGRMTYMFGNQSSSATHMDNLKTVDVTNLDVSEARNLAGTFQSCHSLSSIPGINTWNVQNCTIFNNIFRGTRALKELDLSNWHFGGDAADKSIAMQYAFVASGINYLDISGLDPKKINPNYNIFTTDIPNDLYINAIKLGEGWKVLDESARGKLLGNPLKDVICITSDDDDTTIKAGGKGAGTYYFTRPTPFHLHAKKVDSDNNGLSGAEFYVRNASGQYLKELPQYREEDGGTLKLDKPAKFTNDRSDALVFTSDSDGKLLIDGIDEEIKIDRAGTYILEEKTAPAGYRKDTDQYIVNISLGDMSKYIKGTATPGTTTEELDEDGEPVIHENDEVLIGDSSKYDRNQINYYENKDDGYELKKQAEWEDIEDGRAKISFTVKRPQLDEGEKGLLPTRCLCVHALHGAWIQRKHSP